MSGVTLPEVETETSGLAAASGHPHRPAWIEVDLGQLRRNFEIINADKPRHVEVLSVVKDDAYGHGAVKVARTAIDSGATFLALSSLDEAMELRQRGLRSRMLLLGERPDAELPWCIEHQLTCCVNDAGGVENLARAASHLNRRVPVHLKINTGMNRYGVRWTDAASLAALICEQKSLLLEGMLSHFAMSDETDKTFALL